ncbi:hypothetical protein [Treponema porcinum]|uniref:Uncharacterized protein n=1 Tax=Treponema porcinum TaxID=261392 RepID=A0A1T4KMR6_TREPO|nr:hypothetical protein [Treponema porcinum]SJZ43695.1 hypothetical protein SAMN02745149_01243 [Treponema porcinum]
MNKKEMPDSITLNGKRLPLLIQFPVNDHFQIGVYQGTLSDFDMIVRYKQLLDGKWTRARTPKHIHWAVDILIKQHENPEATNRFLDFLLKHWNSVTPLLSEAERKNALDTKTLLDQVNKEALNYPELAEKGEYTIKFLILLAKLLMLQEKTNYPDAYMFKTLLEQLRAHKDIYKIVSTATHH